MSSQDFAFEPGLGLTTRWSGQGMPRQKQETVAMCALGRASVRAAGNSMTFAGDNTNAQSWNRI
jgi:hypothetical protein